MIEKNIASKEDFMICKRNAKFYAYSLQVASFEDETFVRRVECNTPNF